MQLPKTHQAFLVIMSFLTVSKEAPLMQRRIGELIEEVNNLDLEETVLEAERYINHLKNGDVAQSRMDWFDVGWASGRSSFMGPGLSSIVSLLQLGRVAYEFENSLFGAASCTFCKAGFLFLQYYLDRDIGLEEVKRDVMMLCGDVKLVSERVCRGLVEVFSTEVVHVIRNSSQSAEQMCSFMLGEACGGNIANSPHSWTVMIPPGPPHFTLSSSPSLTGSEKTLTILHLSDTHWDPFYSPGSNANCGEPLCCRTDSGLLLDEDSGAGYWGDYRKCDTPLHTIQAMYKHISSHHNIDLIYWTGDLPPHDIWNQTRQGNLDIVRATARHLKEYFPGVPVLPALGNHESVPVDSFPPPHMSEEVGMSWLYETLSEEWGDWLGGGHNWTITHGAYFSLKVAPRLRVISLNMNYCMNKNLWLILDSTDPADELLWLVFELQMAEFRGEKVHILGHIPPGHVDCVRVWSWNFHTIISRFSATVSAQFYGHTHTDQFQVFYSETDSHLPVGVAYIAPAVTPYHGLNPAYRLYTVSFTGEILDHETHTLDLGEANLHMEDSPVWKLLYSAKTAYHMDNLSPESWHNLTKRLQTEADLFEEFNLRRYSGSPVRPSCDSVCRHQVVCSLVSARSHDTDNMCKDVYIRDERGREVMEGWWHSFYRVMDLWPFSNLSSLCSDIIDLFL